MACFDIAVDAAEKTAAEIGEHGGTSRAYRVDVSDPDSVAAPRRASATDLGRPQVVVNSAGIGRFSHTHELPFAEWQRILGVNLTGTFLVCQAALPHLLDGGGSIVNIASNAGIRSQPYLAAYCASKAGVVHLTSCLADEYLKRGVRANCVAPGGMETPLQKAFMEFPEGRRLEGDAQGDLAARQLAARRDRERRRVRRFRRVSLHDRVDRLDRRRHHGMTAVGPHAMIDDARSVWELIERRSAATPDRVMLYDGDRATTFAEYRELCERAAAGLLALGVGAGDERLVAAPDVDRVGRARRRAVPARRGPEPDAPDLPGPRGLVHREADGLQAADHAVDVEQLRLRRRSPSRSRARTTTCTRSSPITAIPRAIRRRCPPRPRCSTIPRTDPVRWIFYTSGTTADPKGAQHTDRSVLAGAIGYAEKTHVVADDIALVAFPFTHIGGIIIGVFTPLLTGSAAVLMEAWTAPASTELIGRHEVTLANGAAAIHAALIEEARANPAAYATVRDFPSGGSTKPPQLHDELKKVVPSSIGTTVGLRHDRGADRRPDRHRRATTARRRSAEGTPTRGVTMKILDSGEIAVKGPQVMRGYVDSSLDADAFTADGFLHTGDLGRFDAHGAILITGRIKDIIIRKGENVSAKEVEDVLYRHPKIADVAVLGIPDEDRGEMVVAFVVPDDRPTRRRSSTCLDHCRERRAS